MIDKHYTSFKSNNETIEDFLNIVDYEKLSKKQQDNILNLQNKIEQFAPDLIHITLALIEDIKNSNTHQEPYKLYYEKALQDIQDRLTLTFATSARIIDNIRLSSLQKKRPPYLILLFKRLFLKLWTLKF